MTSKVHQPQPDSTIAPDLFNDLMIAESGDLIAGVDEAGRGPLAGPVVAAAVILDPNNPIDELNILQATMLAMKRAIVGLSVEPNLILVDGNRIPKMNRRINAIVKGDDKVPAISAASILAKTTRDSAMIELDVRYPEYGFAKHKGYGVKQHIEAIRRYGILPVHRKSFSPVKEMLAGDDLLTL